FPDVYYRFKFCAYTAGGKERTFKESVCGFNLRDATDALDTNRCFPIAREDFRRFNTNTGTAPMFSSMKDADLNYRVHRDVPVLRPLPPILRQGISLRLAVGG